MSIGDLPAKPKVQSYSFMLIIASSIPSLFKSYTTGEEKPVHPSESTYAILPSLPFNKTCKDPVLFGHCPLLTKVKKSGMSSFVKFPTAKLLLHSVSLIFCCHKIR